MEDNKFQLKIPDGNARASAENAVSPSCPCAPAPQGERVVCAVCGHINKGQSLICEMCSNYLFD